MASMENKFMVWIDGEYTGLRDDDKILEIACIITDNDLNVVSEDFNVVINQPDAVLENMEEWCIEHHNKSGLVDDCKSSRISLKEAEEMLLNFIKKYVLEGTCPMAGNTIYWDRLYLMKYMPLVHKYLHHRIIDVSTIKQLVRMWNPKEFENAPKKVFCHRALSDIKESIQELKYYKKNIFIS
ncbi:probable oligoribonuclease [Colletes gigas]|uniref:probable oligoribonuclease n=1 Tax=Colletes gigas TaxID=935657 RepID=UPI001C9AE2A3|nr:probable oligoribonuclease [Colletes gigas]XP_043257020.1 probable oligoribonuclease [Colletes gigas]XP_043257021.1 probable oligoribonuclease [Colletes gigas]XP_043257022.1 probable oligoribonuclease [Colletes gigas]XP_043257023.1 probable oligoribonuclease [Colletes gigas]XP_043257024.1 probable oligoribonuclease [Colletes gigas]XP_043257026.1 probable oligoribonuclease [Colletes gigas]